MKLILTDMEYNIVRLLKQYDCLLMFHELRSCFMGAIVCPAENITPLRVISSIWGGELPEFAGVKDANQFFDVLVSQLWDPLTHRQQAKIPFELTTWEYKATRKDLAELAEIRTDEIAIFIEAIEGPDNQAKLGKRAAKAVRVLKELYVFISGIELIAIDKSISKNKEEISELFRELEQMTAIAELEIHETIIACHHRRQILARKNLSTMHRLH